ncbi:MAG TPA: hypothetical protein PLP50_10335 [Thermoanaerobaculia bacterium]|nr:hypothetical protein [Thermoanaerobaculia bacterium]HQN06923.1 hypothetical protein [Thermoanaerobaculia bacterium]HQP84788.1 hypothetical protein [Thermoanaerobaculia bacterium]
MRELACDRLDDLLARREEDRLTAAEEGFLRGHLATCEACAAEALRRDPVLLFARAAAPEPLSAEARGRFVSGVLAATATAKAGRRLQRAHARPVLRLAASLLLAASVAGVWLARDGGDGAGEVPRPELVAAADEGIRTPPDVVPAVEDLGGDTAVVYQFPSTRPGEPTVVFVVDRNADI